MAEREEAWKNINRKGELEKEQNNKENDLEKHRVRELIYLPSDTHEKLSHAVTSSLNHNWSLKLDDKGPY